MGLDLPSLGLGLTARCHLIRTVGFAGCGCGCGCGCGSWLRLWLWLVARGSWLRLRLLARLLARLLFGVPDAI